MQPRLPTAAHRSAARQQPAMQFEWRKCRVHWWLQKSVLVGNSFSPVCFTETGKPHPVDPGELELAS